MARRSERVRALPPPRPARRPQVVTFYSYKGGVGRSLLAGNVAALLARRGNTLLWDLDVEAPGLHQIADLRATGPVKPGFLEWLLDWQRKRPPAPSGDGVNTGAGLELTAAQARSLGQALRSTNIERLQILPAHGSAGDPAALYFQIDWARWFQHEVRTAYALFEALLHMLGGLGIKQVVIDSRTGHTDLGGMLTALLPDVTVLVTGYGPQALAGAARVWRALRQPPPELEPLRGERGELVLLAVGSPIPQHDSALVAQGRERAREAFGGELHSLIEVPYHVDLPLTDRLLFNAQGSEVAAAYARVADAVADVFQRIEAEHAAAEEARAVRPDLFAREEHAAAADPRLAGRLRVEQGARFEDQVAELLRLLGYQVEAEQLVDSNKVDLVARLKVGLEQATYLVECKDQAQAVPKETLEKLHGWTQQPLARQLRARGMVVSRRGFSPAALRYAADQGLQAVTPAELERGLIDFAPYLDKLIRGFEQTPLFNAYVTQRAQPGADGARQTQGEIIEDLVAQGRAWAAGEGKRLWVLLGDYGTGKSAFVSRLAYELAIAARDAARDERRGPLQRHPAPVPLAINLRFTPNKASLDEVLAEHWLRLTGERRDPQLLLYLLQRGRVVLLLDSFDEMGIATAGRSVVEQFRMLVSPAARVAASAQGNRVLVTCREQFFKEHGEAQRAARGSDERIPALQGVTLGLDGSIDRLLVFTQKQVREFLRLRLGEGEADKAWHFMRQHGLAELGDRPQLLDVIIQSLPALRAQGGSFSPGALYGVYTNQWLDEFKPTERVASSAQLKAVLEVLAGLLWQREGNRLHYADLYSFLRERPELCAGLDPNQLDVELRTAAFLSRTPDGHYGFSHRSFLEFFLARRIESCTHADDPGAALAAVLDAPRLTPEACGFVADLVPAASEQRDALATATRWVLGEGRAPESPRPPALARAGALHLGYELAKHDSPALDSLPRYLPRGADLAQTDLRGTTMPHVRLPGAELSAARLDDVTWPRLCSRGPRRRGR